MRIKATNHAKVTSSCCFLSIIILLSFLFLNGCATVGPTLSAGSPQTIGVSEKLNVHLYSSYKELRSAYLYRGGDLVKFKRLKGFYSPEDNSIHCLKWDFYSCGHELYHALQYKGDTDLYVEKGHEHFKENNYTSQ